MPKHEPNPNTFAGRKAARERRARAGEAPPHKRQVTLRAGVGADNPLLIISHVEA